MDHLNDLPAPQLIPSRHSPAPIPLPIFSSENKSVTVLPMAHSPSPTHPANLSPNETQPDDCPPFSRHTACLPRHHGNKVYHQINLASPGGWPNRDYRVPDLVLLTPDCFHIDHNEYFEGAPTVVVEIHSPNDESYEKLAFYHGLRVPEVWIVHRDTRQPEIHVWGDQEYTVARANENGSVRSSATHIEMRASENRHLIVRFAGDVATERGLPE
jgi:hypothetical protein